MALQPKVINAKLNSRGMIKLPQVVIEEMGLTKGSMVQVMYGKNYNSAVIVPVGVRLEGRQAERIAIIVNESLS